MTTNKPEVVAWRWRKPVVNDQGETTGATAWKLGDAPEFLPWWTNEPLIRLSDYEALQAECEALRTCLAETAGVGVTMLYGSHRQDTLKEFDVTELSSMVDYTKHLADANVQVEKVYRKAWDMARGCAGTDWGRAMTASEPTNSKGGES